MDERTAVIVGGGATAAAAVAGLREGEFSGRILVVAAEPQLPYDWLALAEEYLPDAPANHDLFPYDDVWYATAGAELHLGEQVVGLDREKREVTLESGQRLAYDLLLLATGTESTPLGVPGEAEGRLLGNVHDLETVAGATALRSALAAGGHAVVVGSGWAALHAAAAARHWGAHVTLLVARSEPLEDVVGREGGEVLADLHHENGVDVRAEQIVAEIRPDGVVTAAGDLLPASVVIVATEPKPASLLAETAGLTVEDGVVVDGSLRTSDPAIWAAGSLARVPYPVGGGTVRWDNAENCATQGRLAGLAMAGVAAEEVQVPHFRAGWYGASVEFSGSLAGGYDEVVFRGEDEGEDDESLENFCAFWLREGHVVAAMAVDSEEHDPAALVGMPGVVEGGRLADLGTPLEALR